MLGLELILFAFVVSKICCPASFKALAVMMIRLRLATDI